MEFIGYARVSTREQNLDLQLDALKSVGCERIFMEKASGVKERPELDKALSYLRAGDTFVIWKLDRLGRSLKELVSIVDGLQKRNIAFISISDGINTSSALGKCQFGIFAALAEYEREMIIERTKAGLQAARERGKLGGRPKGLSVEGKRKAKAAIENDDLECFLSAVRASQETSKNNIKNTYVEGEYEGSPQNIIDDVSKVIEEHGAIRIHGGGFKGTVLAFIKNDFVPQFDKYLSEHYDKRRYFKVNISNHAVNFEKL